jgi:hypothetical protein
VTYDTKPAVGGPAAGAGEAEDRGASVLDAQGLPARSGGPDAEGHNPFCFSLVSVLAE